MRPRAIRSEGLSAPLVHKGPVVAVGSDGALLVRASGREAPIRCDVLDAGLGTPEYEIGETVVFATYAEDPDTGCVLGRLHKEGAADAPVRRRALRLEVEELDISARERATIQTGNARIRLTRQGDLELIAHTVVSRARRLQKLLAPILRFN